MAKSWEKYRGYTTWNDGLSDGRSTFKLSARTAAKLRPIPSFDQS